MPRPSKIEVSAINLRIPSDRSRNYAELINRILNLRRGVRIHGENYVALTEFNESTGVGVFSKYSEIDLDKDWFDIEDFGTATPESLSEIRIPEHLKPNLSAFYFELDESLHVVAFETYSDSKSLSGRSVEKYFREVLTDPEILSEFGRVEADLVKDYGKVEQLLALPQLKSLEIVIRLPNPIDISGSLAERIEERLREQNAEEYREELKSKDEDGLQPNERTRQLAFVAAENGDVVARSLVNGVITTQVTDENPLKEVDTYNSETASSQQVFKRLATRILQRIRNMRAELTAADLE